MIFIWRNPHEISCKHHSHFSQWEDEDFFRAADKDNDGFLSITEHYDEVMHRYAGKESE